MRDKEKKNIRSLLIVWIVLVLFVGALAGAGIFLWFHRGAGTAAAGETALESAASAENNYNTVCDVEFHIKEEECTEDEIRETEKILEKRAERLGISLVAEPGQGGTIHAKAQGKDLEEEVLKGLARGGKVEFVLYENLTGEDGAARPSEGEDVQYGENDVVLDHADISEVSVDSAQADKKTEWSVRIVFTEEGTQKFAILTERHIDEPLAIVIDGKLFSTPVIRAKIEGGECIINGNVSESEAKLLTVALSMKPLPLALTAEVGAIRQK